MDTLNEVMTELLIDQNERMDEQATENGKSFAIQALKAEKIIRNGMENHANKN
jgi:hypothetical protein